jgi:undecaprenyl-diphosphatase
MNDTIQDWINGLAGHSTALDISMKLFAKDIIVLMPFILIVLWFWPAGAERAKNQRLAACAFLAVFLALGFASLLGHLYHEARPFTSDLSTKLLVSHSADNGFPSDHATVVFAVTGATIYWRRLLGFACLALAVLVAVARVYVGVHWPSDVIAGATIGLFAGLLLARFAPLLSTPQRWCKRFLPELLLSAS